VTPLSDAIAVLCILLICALPLAIAGLAILNTGLGRSRSAAQSLLGSLCLVAVAVVVYFIVGFSWQGYQGGTSYALALGSTTWDWIAAQSFFFRTLAWNGSPASFIAASQLFAVALAALIPWGAGADRWRLAAASVSTVVTAGLIYPIFAHWVWGGGWLAHLGLNFNIGAGFVDPGGAATIQVIGGLTALSIVWIVGPRKNKFADAGPPRAIPGHHIVYVLFGSLLVLAGWLALNTLGAVLFADLSSSSLVLVEVNTLLCASAALLAALIITRFRFGKPDASLCANGWIAGLVASSAVAAYVAPGFALLVGVIAGGALPFVVEFLEVHCRIDDPTGAISVHGISGVWGLLAVGLFSNLPAGQLLAQLVGIGTLVGLMLPAIYGANWLLDKVIRFRTTPDGERLGMDLHELGAAAYPEFVIHGDEFSPR
jgi:ammonium transporter, Amt family